MERNSGLEIMPIEKWGIFSPKKKPWIIAGPCSAESEDQVLQTAKELSEFGVDVFRAGIWKPRTHPGSFEGVGELGVEWLKKVQSSFGMKVITEVANGKHVEKVLEAGLDMVWIGARTTSNPFAVQEIADALKGVDIPVLIKNPVNPDIELWIGAMERMSLAGIHKLGAIHRGFSPIGKVHFRNIPLWQLPIELKCRYEELAVFCDPSHITGDRQFIKDISQKALDMGFEGLMIESHPNPEQALSDIKQQIKPSNLNQIIGELVVKTERTSPCEYLCEIDKLRLEMDRIDEDLLDILEQRMQLSSKIGEYKKRHNITILQKDRWKILLGRVVKHGNEKGLNPHFVKSVYELIHEESINWQRENRENGEEKSTLI